jgi:predicted transcriptional regulator
MAKKRYDRTGTNDETVSQVTIANPDDFGKAAYNHLDNRLNTIEENTNDLDDIPDELDSISNELENLKEKISSLENKINEIEYTKASVRRRELEGYVDRLEAQLDEKKDRWQELKKEVLDDYRDSIERLKDRFVSAISGDSEPFEQVEEEFGRVEAARTEAASVVEPLDASPNANYEHRAAAVDEAQQACEAAIDNFLDDREDTAATIDSLQTPLPGVGGASTVNVPFWVVGIERDGREEIRVLPVLDRGSGESATRAEPYGDYLRQHGTHQYGDLRSAVHEYVSRDEVRDNLASREDGFADLEFMRRRDEVLDRFVDALERYQLGSGTARSEAGTDADGRSRTGTAEAHAEVAADG